MSRRDAPMRLGYLSAIDCEEGMAGKKLRKERPFRPAEDGPFPDSLPECGVGTQKQIDVHDTKLFDVPPRGSSLYFKELARLTKKLNVFQHDSRAMLRKKQEDLRDKSIELTIALSKGGLYLTYARPVRTELSAAKPLSRDILLCP